MSAPHKRLDQAMNARRLDLDKQWKDVAQEAGISTAALGAIRRGENKPSQLNARRLEDALRWKHGSVRAILAGGEPTPIKAEKPRALPPRDEPTSEPTVADLAERVERLEQAVQPRPPEPDEENRIYTMEELEAMSPAERLTLMQEQIALKQRAQRQIDAHLDAMIRILREATPVDDDAAVDQE